MELFGIVVVILMLVILGERIFSLEKKLFSMEDRLSGENRVTRSDLIDLIYRVEEWHARIAMVVNICSTI